MSKRIIVANIIGVIVVVLLIALGGYFYVQNKNYVKTDDAVVSADMMGVVAPTSGILTNWDVKDGKNVTNKDIVGKVSDGKNEIPVDAKMDGKVIKNEARKNQMVQAGQELAKEADLDHMYIIANIEETDLKDIEIGDRVDITVDGDNDTTFDGTVKEIGYATNSVFSVLPSSSAGNYTKVTQKVPVKISINQASDKVLPGMNAEIKISL
ncbi:efflux RND transporter periplasmic adaptor subunit [Heyndrickxia vini]|uniref:Efflux RND transporter periplasmic adaptor subunit n=1 Tax=Heyndrickxia vini TaxID=1476025 RepID=A0ABX7E3J8_9BACI|nr:efflux RND transporter periplasmic adaptor subunit [Heyndrickxia vini]QQZ08932.1 efflux RND transporter periplasmic adaptor subunit [Heyndrickxia vini]